MVSRTFLAEAFADSRLMASIASSLNVSVAFMPDSYHLAWHLGIQMNPRLELPEIKQAQDGRPAAGHAVGRSVQLLAVLDGHFQKIMRVEKGLDDRPCVAKPVLIV